MEILSKKYIQMTKGFTLKERGSPDWRGSAGWRVVLFTERLWLSPWSGKRQLIDVSLLHQCFSPSLLSLPPSLKSISMSLGEGKKIKAGGRNNISYIYKAHIVVLFFNKYKAGHDGILTQTKYLF